MKMKTHKLSLINKDQPSKLKARQDTLSPNDDLSFCQQDWAASPLLYGAEKTMAKLAPDYYRNLKPWLVDNHTMLTQEMVKGLAPKTGLEMMLAVQMANLHTLQAHLLHETSTWGVTDSSKTSVSLNQLERTTKLLHQQTQGITKIAHVTTQMALAYDALQRKRQPLTASVYQVNVAYGGQVVVGDVMTYNLKGVKKAGDTL